MDSYRQLASTLRALGHPLRLRILEILEREECCVCHLTTVLRQRQPYVSQQLMRLRQAGLVLDRKEGAIVYYRLAGDEVARSLAAARELLRAQGIAVASAPVPRSPARGCPCPKCQGGPDRHRHHISEEPHECNR